MLVLNKAMQQAVISAKQYHFYCKSHTKHLAFPVPQLVQYTQYNRGKDRKLVATEIREGATEIRYVSWGAAKKRSRIVGECDES